MGNREDSEFNKVRKLQEYDDWSDEELMSIVKSKYRVDDVLISHDYKVDKPGRVWLCYEYLPKIFGKVLYVGVLEIIYAMQSKGSDIKIRIRFFILLQN